MSQFDDELRAAASRLAPESLPDDLLDESLDVPVDGRRSAAVLVTIAGALILAVVAFGPGRWLPTDGIGPPLGADLPVVRNDPRFAACGGNAFPVMAAFPLERASDFAQRFPNAGKAPELDGSSDPAFVVVFEGQWEGPVLGPIGSYPPRQLDPEHHDLCVWIGDAGTGYQNIYANVDTAGMNAGEDVPSSSPTAPEATPVVQPFEPTPFRGDLATLLSEVEEHMGAQVRVTGDIGIVAEGGPILTLTSTGTGMGEILVVFDTRLNGGQYSLDYVRGEPAIVEGTLLELTAVNIDSIGDRYIDGATVIEFMRGPNYLIIATSVVQR
jgi:hypothetical protein